MEKIYEEKSLSQGGQKQRRISFASILSFVVAAFAFVAGMAIFLGIKYTHGLRCDRIIEEEGLDIYEHGEACYN